jgi:SAM-dependent methyltransferase
VVPWDRGAPHPLLVEWLEREPPDGFGRRALVVGSGPGNDAERLAAHGFDTVAFDVSPTAVAAARRRFPDSPVDYRVADLLAPPAEWREAFDLVLEVMTVQSMPPAVRARATAGVTSFVAPGGRLLVITTARASAAPHGDGPPWPLSRDEVDAFADGGALAAVRIEERPNPERPEILRWRAEFRRGEASPHAPRRAPG